MGGGSVWGGWVAGMVNVWMVRVVGAGWGRGEASRQQAVTFFSHLFLWLLQLALNCKLSGRLACRARAGPGRTR